MAQKKSRKRKIPPLPEAPKAEHPSENVKWWREAVESLVIAIVLALLIRAFEAEAFVIPTGSMAPTLMGQHKDVKCDSCGYRYRSGASEGSEDGRGRVEATVCPMCSYAMDVVGDRFDPNNISFTGDRILVNKFAYDFGREPERWDVIVFKYPGNAKQNYIKRLIGLPGETIRIWRGDIFVREQEGADFKIARKPAKKLRRLLQLVHDTKHIPAVLDEAGLPPRWQSEDDSSAWATSDSGRTFSLSGTGDTSEWIRYQHIQPSMDDWAYLNEGKVPEAFQQRRGQLISDFYAYNASFHTLDARSNRTFAGYEERASGKNWVGDLALECQLEVKSDSGLLLFDLVEGGWHFECQIDVATGIAKLSIDGDDVGFADAEGVLHAEVEGQTKLRGQGKYRVMFSNVDNELRLWVNNRLIRFDGPTTYDRDNDFRPAWSAEDPGDLAPLAIGGQGVELQVDNLRVWRDVYYVAVGGTSDHGFSDAWSNDPARGDYARHRDAIEIESVFADPASWSTSDIFDDMRHADFTLADMDDDRRDQFLPMGDNSPQSKDGRIWGDGVAAGQPGNPVWDGYPYLKRELLTGQAILVYWPHPWHVKIPGADTSLPVLPNLKRMGIIR